MQEYGKADGRQACVMLRQFLEERYKGHPARAVGRCPARSQFTYWISTRGCSALASGRPHLVAEPLPARRQHRQSHQGAQP